MKKILAVLIGSFVFAVILSFPLGAVVPYPVSLQEEGVVSPADEAGSSSPRNVSQVTEKLAEDQRHLESVLQDLKENQKALKESIQQSSSKENPDGHSLR